MSGKNSNNKKIKEVKENFTIVTNMRDYSKDPYVIKKVESMKKLIEKYGFPKELLND
jgi:hypothetical protein